MVDVDSLSSKAEKLLKMIEKTRIVSGVLEDDPVTWELHVSGKVLKIPAEKMESQGVFRAQYIRVFNRPAPKVKTDEWDLIVEIIAGDAEHVTEIEESDNVYIARQVFEEIKKLHVTEDDEESASTGRVLLKRDGVYYLIASKVEEIIETKKYRITPNRLSPAMYQLGMKTKGTARPYINNKQVRAWEFLLDCDLQDASNCERGTL